MGFRMNFNGHWADSYLYVKLYEQVATTTSPVFQEDWLYDKLQHIFCNNWIFCRYMVYLLLFTIFGLYVCCGKKVKVM